MVMGDMELSTDLLVIGAGPGGYGAAFRAADQGLDVVLVDPFPTPGGFCLYTGCIGSKTLLSLGELIQDALSAKPLGIHFAPPQLDLPTMQEWKNSKVQSIGKQLAELAAKRSIMWLVGKASFDSSNSARIEGSEYSRILFKHAVIATGTRAGELPDLPFGDGDRLLSPASALDMSDIPEKMLILGDSFSALELGTIYANLGTKITLVSEAEELLPHVDSDLVQPLKVSLGTLFDGMFMDCSIGSIEQTGSAVNISFTFEGSELKQSYDRVIVEKERLPEVEGLGLQNTNVTVDSHGFIECDDRQRTNDNSIYACGDICGGQLSAHKSIREGRVAAENICGLHSGFDVRALVAVIYTDPQISWCGLTETAATLNNISVSVQKFPWQFSGRTGTSRKTDGLTKLITDSESGRILGGGVTGRGAENMIGEIALAIEMGATAEDLALTLHPHPTLSETISEAAELYVGNPIHVTK